MKAPEFNVLSHSRSVSGILRAFSDLTGLPVRLAATNPHPKETFARIQTCPLCRLIVRTSIGRSACRSLLERLQSRLEQTRSTCAVRCFAGLTELAVPVLVDGLPVATLLCGGALPHKRSVRKFEGCLRRLRRAKVHLDIRSARKAYYQTIALSAHRARAARIVLSTLAHHLGELAAHCLLVPGRQDPPCVARAKAFAQSHWAEAVKTRDAAHEVQVTEEYFCRAFKAATGMTFSEYVARVRIERAKQLLADPALRVTDVAFAAGFQSIPHFNHTFKRHNGTSPKKYRAKLRGSL